MKTNRRGFFGALAGMLAAPFVARALPVIGPEPLIETTIPLTINFLRSCDFIYSEDELRFSVVRANGYWQHAMNQMKSQMLEGLDFYRGDQWGRKWDRLTATQRRFDPRRLPA